MRKHIIVLTAFIASMIGIGVAQAQEARDFSLLATQTVQLPGTGYSIVFNSPELQVGEPRDTARLSVAISSWLSANFGLPIMRHMPKVAYVADLESRAPTAYDSRSHTIYLPVGWNGSSPAELTVFVRAMVDHLQNEAGADYRCTPERLADAVQSRWAALFAAAPTDAAASPSCTFRQSRIEN
jgi:hypothetical protein